MLNVYCSLIFMVMSQYRRGNVCSGILWVTGYLAFTIFRFPQVAMGIFFFFFFVGGGGVSLWAIRENNTIGFLWNVVS